MKKLLLLSLCLFGLHAHAADAPVPAAKASATRHAPAAATTAFLAALPMQYAVQTKRGKGRRHIVVFEDPNCPYCKIFHRTIQDVDDLTIHTFVLDVLGPDSVAKARAIWCAPDQGKALEAWMLRGLAPAEAGAACENPRAQLLALAQSLNVNGTPTIFFADGSRAGAIVNSAQFEKQLAGR